jgi:hypothetical protein
MIVHLRLADTYTSTKEPHSTRGGSKTVAYSNSYYIIDISISGGLLYSGSMRVSYSVGLPNAGKKEKKKTHNEAGCSTVSIILQHVH